MLRKALDEYHVVGVSTNVEFLRNLAGNQSFINGEVETGFITKHFTELLPSPQQPDPEIVAQAALYVALRDWNTSAMNDHSTPWTSLTSRRFGGDEYKRTIAIQSEGQEEGCTVNIISTLPGQYEVLVTTPGGNLVHFSSVTAHLFNNILSASLNHKYTNTVIISQPPHTAITGTHSSMERLHVFSGGRKTTVTLPVPKWLRSLAGDATSSQGLLKAPMPSLIVELRVNVGDRVEKGQGIVVLESMKTETILRADTAGVVKSVGCIAGEQVEEGRELVEIEFE